MNRDIKALDEALTHLFKEKGLITHITTNLTATEIETIYGNRLRSRMREMFNLFGYEESCWDKRK